MRTRLQPHRHRPGHRQQGRFNGGTNKPTVPDDTHTVTITVTNVFEVPRFGDDDGSGTTTRTVPENTVADQNIGAPASATDDENDTLTYELSGTDDAIPSISTPAPGKSRLRTLSTTSISPPTRLPFQCLMARPTTARPRIQRWTPKST